MWKDLIRIENDATALFNYEPQLVPGLLQTGDYATAVIRSCNRDLPKVRLIRWSGLGWGGSRC